MSLRSLLLALIVVATAAFVIGTSIERSSAESGHHETPTMTASGPGEAVRGRVDAGASSESAANHAREGAVTSAAAPTERTHAELRPLGVNVESLPFVVIASVASLTLGLAIWLRPSLTPLVGLVLVAMLGFTALDISEAGHQSDLGRTGLAILAGIVAAGHLAAAVVAMTMAARIRRPNSGTPAAAGTIPG